MFAFQYRPDWGRWDIYPVGTIWNMFIYLSLAVALGVSLYLVLRWKQGMRPQFSITALLMATAVVALFCATLNVAPLRTFFAILVLIVLVERVAFAAVSSPPVPDDEFA